LKPLGGKLGISITFNYSWGNWPWANKFIAFTLWEAREKTQHLGKLFFHSKTFLHGLLVSLTGGFTDEVRTRFYYLFFTNSSNFYPIGSRLYPISGSYGTWFFQGILKRSLRGISQDFQI